MAVFPNSSCENFCIWMQATAWLKITAPQNVIIEEVKDAANAATSVTDHVWNEFLRTTGLWWQYYTAYLAQTEDLDWQDFGGSTTLTGFSSTTIKQILWKKSADGKILFVNFSIFGTSNATTFTWTLPFSLRATLSAYDIECRVQNNGAVNLNPGFARTTINSDLVTMFVSNTSGVWTAANGKGAIGQLFVVL